MVTHDKVANEDYPVQSIIPNDIINEEEPLQMVRIEKGQQKLVSIHTHTHAHTHTHIHTHTKPFNI